ncbi:MAG: YceI family protein [Saprospiraceae bacterium]
MKQVLLLVLACMALNSTSGTAQKLITRDARIQFDSDMPLEKITGINKSGTAVLDTETGRMEWKALIKGFVFEKALLQEHFNENYMESNKFPSATFKGNLLQFKEVNFAKNGTYNVKAKGKMQIHGVEKDFETPGTLVVENGNAKISASFEVACADYGIEIPGAVRDKIAKTITVKIDAKLAPKN